MQALPSSHEIVTHSPVVESQAPVVQVPPPPPHHFHGKDRITMLPDTLVAPLSEQIASRRSVRAGRWLFLGTRGSGTSPANGSCRASWIRTITSPTFSAQLQELRPNPPLIDTHK